MPWVNASDLPDVELSKREQKEIENHWRQERRGRTFMPMRISPHGGLRS
jgi:hypothetical protein